MRLDELASQIGCKLQGDGSIDIVRVATLEDAQPGDVTFLSNPRYAHRVPTARASAIVVATDYDGDTSMALLRTRDPYAALAKALELFHRPVTAEPGVHATAIVHPTAQVGPNLVPPVGVAVLDLVQVPAGAAHRLGRPFAVEGVLEGLAGPPDVT